VSNVRLWHSYAAVLIAPSVLFFAFTGALQLFNLHEAHDGYQPAAFIEKLGRLHKDQIFAPDKHHHPAAQRPPASSDDDSSVTRRPTLLLKYFFLVVAIGLISTTSLGLWIAFTRQRRPALTWALLVAGIVVPLLLLMI
jgi:hypothetical protein